MFIVGIELVNCQLKSSNGPCWHHKDEKHNHLRKQGTPRTTLAHFSVIKSTLERVMIIPQVSFLFGTMQYGLQEKDKYGGRGT